ncbi:type VI secretion system tip protein TssI/VgrG [Acuticoccus sp. MNP-M23]|uniref:type VI secretion system Vgr family protein n=1 Tax=Acuticoccus sp. MNP-M23 TaxID=3072793 RepID=UPI00281630BF|nr:type VI secretion system tip protein TssI/VgrG [Acuticoccus sp. MNP-M23]WMS44140.1 type VI secretion system tip protein TssI/VgrG [Acuticoccus sp. MNP-M23]
MATPTQDQRVAQLKTPLGKDVLNAVRFDGTEGLSTLFEFSVEAIGDKNPVDFDGAIGKNCTLSLHGKTTARNFSGIMVGADWLGESDSHNLYRIVLRPWLWLLSRTSDSRIYHKKTTPQIIEDVFGKHGFSDFTLKLTESYPPREYTVQYRESDLDFVCRLMEEDGIYYFFEHSDMGHKLILADAKSSHTPVPNLPDILFVDRLVGIRTDSESFLDLTAARSFSAGKVALNDYDYGKPSAQMETSHNNPSGYTNDGLEIYDYPGRYTETGDGNRFAKVRLEAEQAGDKRRKAVGDVPAAYPGGLVRLKNHPQDSENIEYLVVGCRHTFEAQDYRSTASAGDGRDPYNGAYELQPSDRQFRAPRSTPKPIVRGPQTAKVVGASGEEIDVDAEGRILVQFHWDRQKDQSRRVRVAQAWAGKGWGAIMIPRIGQEVVVEYLEGDPDQPLVVGTVYNAEKTVPYDLPANKTKGGIKSNSSKGGSGYNEIVLEDKKDSEEIGIHAQKDMNIVILNSETREIGEKFTAGTSRETTLKKGDDALTLDTGSQTVDIARNQEVKAGQSITIEAGMKMTFKVGSSKIELTPSGIDIKAAGMIKINGAIIKLN